MPLSLNAVKLDSWFDRYEITVEDYNNWLVLNNSPRKGKFFPQAIQELLSEMNTRRIPVLIYFLKIEAQDNWMYFHYDFKTGLLSDLIDSEIPSEYVIERTGVVQDKGFAFLFRRVNNEEENEDILAYYGVDGAVIDLIEIGIVEDYGFEVLQGRFCSYTYTIQGQTTIISFDGESVLTIPLDASDYVNMVFSGYDECFADGYVIQYFDDSEQVYKLKTIKSDTEFDLAYVTSTESYNYFTYYNGDYIVIVDYLVDEYTFITVFDSQGVFLHQEDVRTYNLYNRDFHAYGTNKFIIELNNDDIYFLANWDGSNFTTAEILKSGHPNILIYTDSIEGNDTDDTYNEVPYIILHAPGQGGNNYLQGITALKILSISNGEFVDVDFPEVQWFDVYGDNTNTALYLYTSTDMNTLQILEFTDSGHTFIDIGLLSEITGVNSDAGVDFFVLTTYDDQFANTLHIIDANGIIDQFTTSDYRIEGKLLIIYNPTALNYLDTNKVFQQIEFEDLNINISGSYGFNNGISHQRLFVIDVNSQQAINFFDNRSTSGLFPLNTNSYEAARAGVDFFVIIESNQQEEYDIKVYNLLGQITRVISTGSQDYNYASRAGDSVRVSVGNTLYLIGSDTYNEFVFPEEVINDDYYIYNDYIWWED